MFFFHVPIRVREGLGYPGALQNPGWDHLRDGELFPMFNLEPPVHVSLPQGDKRLALHSFTV